MNLRVWVDLQDFERRLQVVRVVTGCDDHCGARCDIRGHQGLATCHVPADVVDAVSLQAKLGEYTGLRINDHYLPPEVLLVKSVE